MLGAMYVREPGPKESSSRWGMQGGFWGEGQAEGGGTRSQREILKKKIPKREKLEVER